MIGEDLDLMAARGHGVCEAGHQDFDAAEIGREALGGEGERPGRRAGDQKAWSVGQG